MRHFRTGQKETAPNGVALTLWLTNACCPAPVFLPKCHFGVTRTGIVYVSFRRCEKKLW
jgi:hypothetical protein